MPNRLLLTTFRVLFRLLVTTSVPRRVGRHRRSTDSASDRPGLAGSPPNFSSSHVTGLARPGLQAEPSHDRQ
eukprot:206608-Hanusia_phi.AAC.1